MTEEQGTYNYIKALEYPEKTLLALPGASISVLARLLLSLVHLVGWQVPVSV